MANQQDSPTGPNTPTTEKHLWEFRWVRDLLWIMVAAVVAYLAYKVRAVLAPVAVGMALAYAANPIVNLFQRRLRLPRWAGTGIILFSVAFVLGIITLILAPIAWQQASDLIHKTPGYIERIAERAAPTAEQIRQRGDSILRRFVPAKVRPGAGSAKPGQVAPDLSLPDSTPTAVTLGDTRAEPVHPDAHPGAHPGASTAPSAADPDDPPLLDFSKIDWSQVGTVLFTGVASSLTLVGFTIALGAYLVIAFIIALFCFIMFSWKFDRLLAWGREFIPVQHEDQTLRILGRMDNAVSSFLRGRLIQITILSINLTITWWIAGVPYFVLLALGTAMLNIVPYASFIGLPIAIITVWVDRATSGAGFDLLHVVIFPTVAFILPQQLDNWVIEPVVQGKATSLDPLSVMLAVATGGALLGILGVVIAIPTAACIKILLQELILPRLRRFARPPGGIRPSG